MNIPVARSGRHLPTPATGFPAFYSQRRIPRIIAADIWALLIHLLERELAGSVKAEAVSYLQQAAEFDAAARTASTRSRPLLHYYSFLNATKAFLLARGVALEAQCFHGISDPKANARQRLQFKSQTIKISDQRGSKKDQVFRDFVQNLGHGAPQTKPIKVLDLLSQVPSIHRTYVKIAGDGAQPLFTPVVDFQLFSDGSQVWVRAIFSANDRDVQSTLSSLKTKGAFSSLFTQVRSNKSDEIWFDSTGEPGYGRWIDRALGVLADSLRRCGISWILTGNGYRYYFSIHDNAVRLPQLASAYGALFYLGSITRYKPYDYEKIVSGNWAWLVNEFLSTQPDQFFYGLASSLAGVDVVMPFAR